MMNRRNFSLALGASMASMAAPAFAQSYPDKPIKLIVPYAAGGGTIMVSDSVPSVIYVIA